MLAVCLVTLGSPEQLTGGYLYHRRMAELAPRHDACVELLGVPELPFPLPGVFAGRVIRRAAPADVLVIDSIAAAFVAPWRPPRPLAAMCTSPPVASTIRCPGVPSKPRSTVCCTAGAIS
jgi:hypothetical protein